MQVRALLFILSAVYCCAAVYPVSDTPGLGRRYDGLGGLSGGGATSVLLRQYDETTRNQILDYLFLPGFGASLQILKCEIGGDSQSTQGVEASHMHFRDDLSLERGYEWWLMSEAKLRNPSIKLYGLAWAFPGWVGNGTGDPFASPGLTSEYLIQWVAGAKSAYGLDIDYLGLWNEKPTSSLEGIAFATTLRASLDTAGFSVGLVAGDISEWDIAPFILNTSALQGVFAAIGSHYPSYSSTPEAVATGLPLWASEDYSDFNGGEGASADAAGGAGAWGAACWVRTVNRNFVSANITGAIMWHLTSAIYDHMWWYGASALNAPQPWSGYYEVTPTLWAFAHTTQFSQPGWLYLQNNSGSGFLASGGSYVGLTDPTRQQLTLVIEKIDYVNSLCMHNPLPYVVTDEEAAFVLGGAFAGVTTLHQWYTHYAHGEGDTTVIFEYQGEVAVAPGGIVSLPVRVNDLITLSTMATGAKGQHPAPPPRQPFPLPYASNFSAGTPPSGPDYWVDQGGVFELYAGGGGAPHSITLRQTVPAPPISWAPPPPPHFHPSGNLAPPPSSLPEPVIVPHTILGEATWADINISASFLIETPGGAAIETGVMLGARASLDLNRMGGVWFSVDAAGGWNVSFNSGLIALPGGQAASGSMPFGCPFDTWHTLALSVVGRFASGWIDGVAAFTALDITNASRNGWAALGTTEYGYAQFDSVTVDALSNPVGCSATGPFSSHENVTLWRCDDAIATGGMAWDWLPLEAANTTIWGQPGQLSLRASGGNASLCLTVDGTGPGGWPGIMVEPCMAPPTVDVHQQWIIRAQDAHVQSLIPWGPPGFYPCNTVDGDIFSVGPTTQLRVGHCFALSSALWQWDPVSGLLSSAWLTEQCAAVCTSP